MDLTQGGPTPGPAFTSDGVLNVRPPTTAAPDRTGEQGTYPADWLPPASEALPSLPGYEVLEVLGWGGMGVVYRARDLKLNRMVALKMVLGGVHASPQELARFQLEAEALASLQHPNIVQVYEVGEHERCPYLALEFVAGGSLDRYLAGPTFPPREAARLVETLSRAMHAAHVRGIVHRDLKPGNVLLQRSEVRSQKSEKQGAGGAPSLTSELTSDLWSLTSDFCPKIADFGLVKKLGASDHTRAGSVLGTPAYMAPEQALGKNREVGPHSDVYSLGAILYELLTGQPPFQGENSVHTLQLVIFAEPRRPSVVAPGRVPRDLETVCLECLHKDPAKRYATAEDLADDLRRFLEDVPIQARRIGSWERLVKWTRRRPTAAALVAVSLTAVLALVSLGLWSYVRVNMARNRAERRSSLARQAVEDMYTGVAEEWLGNEPGTDDLKHDFLMKALAVYEELAREEDSDSPLLRETARARFRMGEIYRQLGKSDEAERAYRGAIELQEKLLRQGGWDLPARAIWQDLGTSRIFLGELLRTTNRGKEARDCYREARQIQERLVEEEPRHAPYLQDLARSHYNDALALVELGSPSAALAESEEAITLLEKAVELDGDLPGPQQDLARALIDRGSLLRQLREPEKARSAYLAASTRLAALSERFPGKPEYRFEKALCHLNRGNLEGQQSNRKQAGAEYQEAVRLLDKLAADFPGRRVYQAELANALNSLGAWEAAGQTPQEALGPWSRASRLLEDLTRAAPNHLPYRRDLGNVEGNLGWLHLRKLMEPASARTHYDRAVQQLGLALGKEGSRQEREDLCEHLKGRAEVALREYDDRLAGDLLDRALAVSPDQARQRYAVARLYSRCASLAADAQQEERRWLHAEKALAQLAAIDPAEPRLKGVAREPDFAVLLGHPKFGRLLERWRPAGPK